MVRRLCGRVEVGEYKKIRTDGLPGAAPCGIVHSRGHELRLTGRHFVYADTGEKLDRDNVRPCKQCGKHPVNDGHDACLGALPGVSFACCGHGTADGYIEFTNGTVLRFRASSVEAVVIVETPNV